MQPQERQFDLRALVAHAQPTGVPPPPVSERRDGPNTRPDPNAPRPYTSCWFPLASFGLLCAASLWDFYWQVLKLCKPCMAYKVEDRQRDYLRAGVLIMEGLEILDLYVRISVVVWALSIVGMAYSPWSTKSWTELPSVELDAFTLAYVAVVAMSVALYSIEHVVDRAPRRGAFAASAEPTANPSNARKVRISTTVAEDEVIFMPCFRTKIKHFGTMVYVVAVYAVGATVLVMSVAVSASAAESDKGNNDVGALAFLIAVLCADVLHAIARIGYAQEISQQSVAAVNIAGLHTMYTLCVVFPFGVVCIMYVLS